MSKYKAIELNDCMECGEFDYVDCHQSEIFDDEVGGVRPGPDCILRQNQKLTKALAEAVKTEEEVLKFIQKFEPENEMEHMIYDFHEHQELLRELS